METTKKSSWSERFLGFVLPLVFMIGLIGALVNGGRAEDKRGDFLLSPEKTFQHYCGPCHGLTGKGDGRYYASGLTPRPADLTAKEISTRDDDYLFKWISDGAAAMGKSNLCPPWGKTIQEKHIRGIVAHLKALSEEDEN